ncbi:FAD binding domain-containing protein [Cladophialophora immunda]|nr:FAD binding domain-containing protein [Cladophialophora immunda]
MESNISPQIPLRTQVLIAGAGPVGAFTALILARSGIEVTLVEANADIDSSPRAMAFQPCALSEMVEAGVYDEVLEHSVKNAVISWWRAGLGVEKEHIATIATKEGDEPFLTGLNCAQSVVTRILLSHLETEPAATIHFGHRVVDVVAETNAKDVVVTLQQTTSKSSEKMLKIVASWLVGADGGRSTVRAAADITFEGFTWPKEEFVATNVYYPFEKYQYTNRNFIIDPVHWAIVGKISNDGLWRVAYGTRPGQTEAQVRAELPEHYKYILPGPGTDYHVEQVNTYRPHQRCAATFRKGRVLLVGDAAHLNNPIGGLGLTTGILDAGPMARALTAVIRRGAPESLLDRWSELRRNSWWEQTNRQSIEFKRIAQQGGYGLDPNGIWDVDEVAEKHGMTQHIAHATPDMREKDEALYEALKDPANQRAARRRVWGLALPPDWMADFEEAAVVERRRKLRPE